MTVWIIRAFFIISCAAVGFQVGVSQGGTFSTGWIGAGAGAGLAGALIVLEALLKKVSLRGLFAAILGLLLGLALSRLLFSVLESAALAGPVPPVWRAAVTLTACYFGALIAVKGRDDFNILLPYVRFSPQDRREEFVILDTSVIIDGRIADICKTKFVEGRFVIPRFVLRELQQIADSQDPIKRNRGRRGLDVLALIQKIQHIDVSIRDEDFPDTREVDAKLVKLAQLLGGKVLTNDFNLNKIAELQGVRVLNINELANALKPVVLPGEMMEARIIKEGKEYNQGVAYLDDGTMVVVEQGRALIGQTVRVLVTSVLQTAAGRMIFAKPESEGAGRGAFKSAAR